MPRLEGLTLEFDEAGAKPPPAFVRDVLVVPIGAADTLLYERFIAESGVPRSSEQDGIALLGKGTFSIGKAWSVSVDRVELDARVSELFVDLLVGRGLSRGKSGRAALVLAYSTIECTFSDSRSLVGGDVSVDVSVDVTVRLETRPRSRNRDTSFTSRGRSTRTFECSFAGLGADRVDLESELRPALQAALEQAFAEVLLDDRLYVELERAHRMSEMQ